MRYLTACIIGLAASCGTPASAQQDSGAGYRVTAPGTAERGAVAATPTPVLRVPGADWNAAAGAEGLAPGQDLAGTPGGTSLAKPKLAAADQDSFLDSREGQNIMTPKPVRGRASTLGQFRGAGEAASLNLAVDAIGKLVDGH
jgi:hypothetical protein